MDNSQREILVTGAGGFVGGGIIAHLVAEGFRVRAAGRVKPPVPTGAVGYAIGDLVAADWGELLAGVNTVIHCAGRAHVLRDQADDPLSLFRAINRDATLRLARMAAASGVGRFIFLSSIGVHGGETRGTPFSAHHTPQPHSAYAQTKWEAEQGLADIARETGLEVVVIRPPLVLGPQPKGNLGRLVAAMRRGLPLPFSAIRSNRRDLVSLDTLADLITCAITHPAAPGTPLLVSDGQPLSTRELIERLAAIHALRARLLPMPPAFLRAALHVAGRAELAAQLLGDLEVDISETRRRLGWNPPHGASA